MAQFQLSLVTITRPLTVPVEVPELAENEDWLVGIFIRGLRP